MSSFPTAKGASYAEARTLYRTHRKIASHENTNMLVYFLRKLPLIGSRLGSQYEFYGAKKFFYFLSPLFQILKGMITTFLALLIATLFISQFGGLFIDLLSQVPFLPALSGFSLGIRDKAALTVLMYGLVVLPNSVFVGSYTSLLKYRDIYRDRMEVLYLEFTKIRPLMDLISRTLVFVLLGAIFPDLSWWEGLAVGLTISLGQLALEGPMVAFYEKTGKAFNAYKLYWALYFVLNLLAILACHFLTWDWLALIEWTLPLSLAAALLSFPRALRPRSFAKLLDRMRQSDSALNQAVEEATSGKSKVSLDGGGERKLPQLGSGATGYAYINGLFFHRYRDKIIRPLLIKAGGLALIGGFLVFQTDRQILKEICINLPFYLPFISYFLLNQGELTQLIYQAWDRPLNHYGFYKEPGVLLRVFFHRLRSTLTLFLVPVLVLVALEVALRYKVGPAFPLFSTLVVSLLWAGFFSIYPYFTYYLFQPYRKGSKLGFLQLFFSLFLYAMVFYIIPNLYSVMSPQAFSLLSGLILTGFLLLASWAIYFIAPKLLKD